MLKIQRSASDRVVLALSGRMEAQDVEELRQVLACEIGGQPLVLNLRNLTLVNQDTVDFLSRCEDNCIKLENCPPYIRKWIDQGKCSTQRRRTHVKDRGFQSH